MEQLLGEKSHLENQLAELGFGFGEQASLSYDPNFADSSQVTAERSEVEALAGKLREALADVERALGKMGTGAYGSCEECGEAISPARLEAKPTARYCITCAGKHR
ncbi:MAG: TraR/DksA family transcriptional regulator [Acidimicrobiales bacterium]